MKIEEAYKLLGRRVQWNPESECSGAGSYGTIVGINLNNSVDDGKLYLENLEDFYFQVAWDSNPQSTMGIFLKDKTLIILDEFFKIENNKKEVVLD